MLQIFEDAAAQEAFGDLKRYCSEVELQDVDVDAVLSGDRVLLAFVDACRSLPFPLIRMIMRNPSM